MTCDLTNPVFTNEEKAVTHFEASRWPKGAFCPHCGSDNVHKMAGTTQAGMYLCNDCRDKFTVRTGTVFERSHIPVHKWLLAMHLMASSKKGISAHQLHRMLGITYKSAWFMAHRIREAMTAAENPPKLGGGGKTVEADETFIGKKSDRIKHPRSGGYAHKIAVLSLVERGGDTRSTMIDGANGPEIRRLLYKHVDPDSRLHTDGAQYYKGSFKRGLVGVYQHIGEQHVDRYLAEFDFRQNNRVRFGIDDATRAARILKGAEGKRLTYRQADGPEAA